MRLAERRPAPVHLSHSQLSTYSQCGERYRLEKMYQIREASWWSSIFGSAIHAMTEDYDRGQFEELELGEFEFYFEMAKARELERNPDLILKPSGNVRTEISWSGGPNKRDEEWCLKVGPEVFDAYVRWREATNWEIAQVFTPDGEFVPAIELPLNVRFGTVEIQGSIDRIWVLPESGEYLLQDLKAGARDGNRLQLEGYRLGVLLEYGIDAKNAQFLSPYYPKPEPVEEEELVLESIEIGDTFTLGGGKVEWHVTLAVGNLHVQNEKGQAKIIAPGDATWKKLKRVVEVEEPELAWGGAIVRLSNEPEYIVNLYEMARRGIEQGVFLPNLNECNGCTVADYCRAREGLDTWQIPIKEEVNG